MKKLIYKILALAIVSSAFVGCGVAPLNSIAQPTDARHAMLVQKNRFKIEQIKPDENRFYIEADDVTSQIIFFPERIAKANLPYALGIAATKTKEKGYRYFNIIAPQNFLAVLKDHKIKNAQELIDVCNDSDDEYQIGDIVLLIKKGSNYTGTTVEGNYRCDYSVAGSQSENTYRGNIYHESVGFIIELTNEKDPNNHTQFEADETLNADDIKDLEKQRLKGTEKWLK